MYRAYFALPEFLSKKGLPTNAIYGTFSMLHTMISDFEAEYVVFCMDTPKPTFRKQLYKEYQAQRPDTPDNFVQQIPVIKQMLDKGGIARAELPGYEADDVIGTLASRYKNDYRVLILSSDKDILQLVDTNVLVVSPKVGISSVMLYQAADVVEKMGVRPDQIPDLKGLMGDPSDNYYGAKGIGPKTANKLLTEYNTIENLFLNIAKIHNEKLRNVLIASKENVFLSKKLATIQTTAPVVFDIHQAYFNGYQPELKRLLQEYNMSTLLERLYDVPKIKSKLKSAKEAEAKDVTQIDLF